MRPEPAAGKQGKDDEILPPGLIRVLDEIPHGVTVQNESGQLIYANKTAAQLIGYDSPAELLNTPAEKVLDRFEMLDEAGRPLPLDQLPGRIALREKRSAECVIRFRLKSSGKERISNIKSVPLHENSRALAINIFQDLTETKRQEEHRNFLLAAGKLLNSSLDYKATLSNIARLAVPHIADWCGVDIVGTNFSLERLVVAHEDQKKIPLAEELARKYPNQPGDKTGTYKVARSGQAEFYPIITEEMLKNSAKNPDHFRLLRQIGFHSAMIVPLRGQDAVLGTITFVNSDNSRSFDRADVGMAEELGRMAGLAVENASSFRKTEEALERQKAFIRIIWRSEESMRNLADAIPQIVWTAAADGQLDYYNRRWYEYTGHKKTEIRKIPDWFAAVHPEDSQSARETWQAALEKREEFKIECRLRNGIGEYRWHLGRAVPVFDSNGQVVKWFGTYTDIHDQKLAEEKVRYQAYHDTLTGLPNRIMLEKKMQDAMREADANGNQCAILFLDLDRFKVINDSLGHRIGDALLCEVAERLRHCTLRESDMVGRLGGDEFTILLTRIASTREAVRIARRVNNLLDSPIQVESHSFHISSSVGIAFYPMDGKDVHALFKNADLALYRAKAYGRNRYQLYNETMNQEANKRLGLENDLRQAIRGREFQLCYQPIVDISQNQVLGAEALVRWPHPQYGKLMPAEFIPVAEETGLILPIGKWVLQTACRDFKKWQSAGFAVPRISVNLSPLQFSDVHLLDHIEKVLKESRLGPECIDVEITESTAMDNIDRTIHKLKSLKHLGVQITIDDFGTGYSSLNYLRRFPLDKLKIDKSFVKHVLVEEQDATLIKTIISIGHTLNLKVVAEGVENARQAALLSTLGCDKLQGYYISPPLDFADATDWLKQRQNRLFSPA